MPSLTRRIMPLLLLLSFVGSLCVSTLARAEDVALRARAEQLMARARAASTVPNKAPGIRTEATFQATADNGTLQTGSYVRLRDRVHGGLRQEVHFGSWQATSINTPGERARIGPWEFPPYAAARILALVPTSVGEFDELDVIREIRDGSSNGQAATCVEFDTVKGDDRHSNEICFSKADGNILEGHNQGAWFTYSKYALVGGSAYPGHIDYHDETKFSLSADVVMTALDVLPEDAFTMPKDARVGVLCKTATSPIARNTPQPEPKGPAGAPVVDVGIRAIIVAGGSVSQPHLDRPVRDDLDAEALKLVRTWQYEPATCNGHPNNVPAHLVVHFQGW